MVVQPIPLPGTGLTIGIDVDPLSGRYKVYIFSDIVGVPIGPPYKRVEQALYTLDLLVRAFTLASEME